MTANGGAENPKNSHQGVDKEMVPLEASIADLHVKDGGKNERETHAGEVAHQGHVESKVRHDDRHEKRERDHERARGEHGESREPVGALEHRGQRKAREVDVTEDVEHRVDGDGVRGEREAEDQDVDGQVEIAVGNV